MGNRKTGGRLEERRTIIIKKGLLLLPLLVVLESISQAAEHNRLMRVWVRWRERGWTMDDGGGAYLSIHASLTKREPEGAATMTSERIRTSRRCWRGQGQRDTGRCSYISPPA